MKRTNFKKINAQQSSKSSELSMDCSCQILYDTSLSNVGDSQCDCSQCLEANLNAFNQFKNEVNITQDTTKHNRKQDKRDKNKHQSNGKQSKQQSLSIHRYRSTDRLPKDIKTNKKWGVKKQNQQRDSDYFEEFKQENQYSNGQLNDFLLITRYRTRKYLQQRKKLQQEQREKRQLLKQKIKKNLQLLKYTVMYQNQNEEKQSSLKHEYKWNHSKYKCQCNGKINTNQKHKCCSKIKEKKALDTNLQKFKQNFMQNRNLILEQIKKRRKEDLKKKQNQPCPDECPNHHNRTDQSKIQKIKQFINKNVKKYYKNQNKKKKQKEQQQKIKQAKLRAIDIKSKEILGRSKKVDDDVSRTSFRLSIQQYDTFSELRQQNQRRKQIKQNDKEVRRAIKEGGGQLQRKIYEEIDEEQLQQLQQPSQIKITTKAEAPQYRKHDQIYERIAYDAQIKPPANLQVKSRQSHKKDISDYRREQKRQQKKKNLSKGKQQQQKKKIQNEIQKKKKQIMQQFNKRNTNKPSNNELRKQYQQKLDKNKQTRKVRPQKNQPQNDPYRTNYPTKAGKNANQVEVHGDPLLQQYTYHREKDRGKAKGPRGQNMEVFNQNIHSLKSKTSLKP